jgi:hypothetical protein
MEHVAYRLQVVQGQAHAQAVIDASLVYPGGVVLVETARSLDHALLDMTGLVLPSRSWTIDGI